MSFQGHAGLPIYNFSTVGMENLAGHVVRVGGGKKNEAWRHFHWLACALERNGLAELGNFVARERRRNERRPDRPRGDAIDANAVFSESLGERTCECDDR